MKKEVKERQLLLVDSMVRAALMGKKRSTWRPIIDKDNMPGCYPADRWKIDKCSESGWQSIHCPIQGLYPSPVEKVGFGCPYGEPGDRLYVREAWNVVRENRRGYEVWNRSIPGECPRGWVVKYRADQEQDFEGPWRPSIHMPRWASRLLYRVDEISVRTLHSITLEELLLDGIAVPIVKAEGKYAALIRLTGKYRPVDYMEKPFNEWSEEDLYRAHFGSFWDEVYRSKGCEWSNNPWCWHIKMKKLRGCKTNFPRQQVIGFG